MLSEAMQGSVGSYVESIEASRGPDLTFRPDNNEPLPKESEGDLTRYLLLAVCIDAGADPWHIRRFLAKLSVELHGDGRDAGLFDVSLEDEALVLEAIERRQRSGDLRGWRVKRHVPRILAEANAFADGPAGGDLDAWARTHDSPAAIVDAVAHGIYFQGRASSEARKKAWLWLRWMVRPAPDLARWTHLDTAELMVPVDRHVGRFALAAGVLRTMGEAPNAGDVREVTAWARTLFPSDPAKVDYALYLWGRGRSNQQQPTRDTCYTTQKQGGRKCPLAATTLSCGARCRS